MSGPSPWWNHITLHYIMLQMYSKSPIIQHFQAYFVAHPLFFPKSTT